MASRSVRQAYPLVPADGMRADLWTTVEHGLAARQVVLLRGLPGSGRSSTLRLLAARLRSVGYAVSERRGSEQASGGPPDRDVVIVVDDLDFVDDGVDRAANELAENRVAGVIATVSTLMSRRDAERLESAVGQTVTIIDIPAPRAPNTFDVRRLPLLAALPSRERELLHIAALADPIVSVRALVHGSGMTDLAALDFLSDATLWGLLDAGRDTWRISLPWLTDMMQRARPRAEIRARHAIIAKGLISDGASPEEISHHLLRSSDRSDTTVAWLTSEASRRIDVDPQSAVAILEDLLESTPGRHPSRDRLRSTLARAYAVAGRAPDVERLVASSRAEGVSETNALPLLIHLGEAMLRDDRVRAAVDALAGVDSTRGEAAHDYRERNTLLALRSLHRVLSGDLDGGAEEAGIARSRGLAIGDDLGVSVALSALAHVEYYRGSLPAAAELALSAVEHADLSDSDEVRRRTRYESGMFLLHADDAAQAQAVFTQELERVERSTDAWYQPLPHIGLGLLKFHSGEWDDAVDHLQTAIRLGEVVSTRWESWAARAHLAIITLERGDLAGAARLLDDVDEDTADSPHHCLDAVLWARGLLLEALGQHREAFGLIERAATLVLSYGVVSRLRWLAPDALRLARRLGRTTELTHLVDALDAVAHRAQCDYVTAAALRTRALSTGDASMAEAAAQLLEDSGRPIESAAAQVDAARLLTEESGAIDTASLLYERARETYERVGANGRLIVLRSEMRSQGIAAPSRRTARSSGASARLTPTERRVAELVAQGLSNPQIADVLVISRRTVETHLSHIFAKLAVKSRLALALRAAEGPIE